MNIEKLKFLKEESLQLIQQLNNNVQPAWGVMNTQQMIEHVADFYNVSSNKIKVVLYTPEEQLPLYKNFLLSDKLFRENTKAPEQLIGEKPLPLRCSNIEEAKNNLRDAVNNFIEYFKNNGETKTLHPVFGYLNFNEWVLLHYKHVLHHLIQFDLIKKPV